MSDQRNPTFDATIERKSLKRPTIARFAIVIGLALIWQGLGRLGRYPKGGRADAISIQHANSTRTSTSPFFNLSHTTKPIEAIKVGDRVIARNPEITDHERSKRTEPDWSQWLWLTVVMPKEDGTELQMELLRSEAWVRSKCYFPAGDVEFDPLVSFAKPVVHNSSEIRHVPLSPLRPIFRELAIADAISDLEREEGECPIVELDLPELAITGPAAVLKIRPAPSIDTGLGNVVTATFRHSAGNVVDLIVNKGRGVESIGTTHNHPFWSEDQQRYVRAEHLTPGETLRTMTGVFATVKSINKRSTRHSVFNLEVDFEHVYFVGLDGILTHNNAEYVQMRLKKLVKSGDLELVHVKDGITRYKATMGPNELLFDVDSLGRTVRAEGVWADTTDALSYRVRRGDRQAGFIGDHNQVPRKYNAGHIFAHEAGGFWDSPNFLVMEATFNQHGTWRSLEETLNDSYAGKRLVFEIEYAGPRSFKNWTARVRTRNWRDIDTITHN
ncbi:MAG: polymorphic toxin-type HINT domain-containing protein [Planctomycetota bacterium]